VKKTRQKSAERIAVYSGKFAASSRERAGSLHELVDPRTLSGG